MRTTLFLGANAAGIAAAMGCKQQGTPEDQVFVISPVRELLMPPTLNGMTIDWMEMDDLVIPVEEVLTEVGINYIEAEAICNDPERHLLLTTKGTFTYDEMIDTFQLAEQADEAQKHAWEHDHLIEAKTQFFIRMD